MFEPTHLALREIRNTFARNQLACTVCAILPPEMNPIVTAAARASARAEADSRTTTKNGIRKS